VTKTTTRHCHLLTRFNNTLKKPFC